MMTRLSLIYKRLRYRKQLKQGFGLLEDLGTKAEFTLVTPRDFIKLGQNQEHVNINIKINKDGTISPIDQSKPSRYEN